MISQLQLIWQLMRGRRQRYGFALGCLLAATVLNYAIPLIGTVIIDHAIASHSVEASPALTRAMITLLGGPDALRESLWIAPVAMLLLSLGAAGFSYLKGWQVSL